HDIIHAVAVPSRLRAGLEVPAGHAHPLVVDKLVGHGGRPRHQSTARSTSRTRWINSSIWPLVMISGGDSAMMSPVVRIINPRSNAFTKASKARLVGWPAIDSSSIALTRPILR